MTKKQRPPLHPEVEAYFDRLEDGSKEPGAATMTSHADRSMPIIRDTLRERHNATRPDRVTPEERESVERLNADLEVDFPKPYPRYREIADRLDAKVDRVRYIMQGSRKKK